MKAVVARSIGLAGAPADPVSVKVDDLVRARFAPPLAVPSPGDITTGLPGPVRTRRRGEGLEFDDLRGYVEGDDLRRVDWKVTARTGRLAVRQFREERERRLTLAADLRPAAFTGTSALRAVILVHLAARLAWTAAEDGDRVAVLAGDGGAVAASRPAAGERGALSVCGTLAEAFADAAARDRQAAAPLAPLLTAMAAGGRQAGRLVLLSTLDGLDDAAFAALADLGAGGRLAVLHVVDPAELAPLPPGRYRVPEGASVRTVTLCAAAAKAVAEAMDRERSALHTRLRQAGVAVAMAGGEAGIAVDAGRPLALATARPRAFSIV